MNRVFMDFVGVAGASLIATALDGLVFWQLAELGVRVGLAAIFSAIFGGVVHFSLCRWGVFRRTNAELLKSVPLYFLMSGTAALLQGGLVEFGAILVAPGIAWLGGKVLIYVSWTFPVSRYVVFRRARS